MKLIALLLPLLLHPLTGYASEMGRAIDAINQLSDTDKIEEIVRQSAKGMERWEKVIVYSNFGWKLNSAGEYKRAEKYFRKSRRYNPKQYEVIGLAISLFNQGKYRASLKVVEALMQKEAEGLLIPKVHKESALYVLGINHQQLKRPKRACSDWKSSYQVRGKGSDKHSYGRKSLKAFKQHCKKGRTKAK